MVEPTPFGMGGLAATSTDALVVQFFDDQWAHVQCFPAATMSLRPVFVAWSICEEETFGKVCAFSPWCTGGAMSRIWRKWDIQVHKKWRQESARSIAFLSMPSWGNHWQILLSVVYRELTGQVIKSTTRDQLGWLRLYEARVFSYHVFWLGSTWHLAHATSPVCRHRRGH